MVTMERVKPSELRVGDRVHVEYTDAIVEITAGGESYRPGVYCWDSVCTNPDDVRDDKMMWSFLHDNVWREGHGWVWEYTGKWLIQGNDLATVVREVK